MNTIRHFLKWVETAKVSERAEAAAALARAYIQNDLSFDNRMAAEAALTLLLDDPSAKVRLALSETLSLSRHAPAQVVAALADDQPEVAAPILVRSPLLSDSDLVDRAATGEAEIQRLLACRPQVSMALSAALAEVGTAEACTALVENDGAEIAAVSFRRMIERHGGSAALRAALAADRRLPPDCRHMLVVRVGEALSAAPLVQALMGAARAEKLAREACIRASITLIDRTEPREHAALVEHLRLRGDLTSGFLVRTVAHGKVDFFGAALVALAGQSSPRVQALLSRARSTALTALLSGAGLKPAAHAPILTALQIWREVAGGKRTAGPQEVSWHMLKALETSMAGTEADRTALATLLKRIHLDVLRENARLQALALAAA
ncbi:DUF2336 domain-containing protein [Chelativorans alearense]|uniref:DUF2336 domain-containing protein n=1 Tax=Chelativorans alearense TaxID=2681495 RepID=UPI0013D2184A|nr:DUF2336 domain-containing protein [Chelativorans alearense]